jgi:Arc/MetJ family transcription regulator
LARKTTGSDDSLVAEAVLRLGLHIVKAAASESPALGLADDRE